MDQSRVALINFAAVFAVTGESNCWLPARNLEAKFFREISGERERFVFAAAESAVELGIMQAKRKAAAEKIAEGYAESIVERAFRVRGSFALADSSIEADLLRKDRRAHRH